MLLYSRMPKFTVKPRIYVWQFFFFLRICHNPRKFYYPYFLHNLCIFSKKKITQFVRKSTVASFALLQGREDKSIECLLQTCYRKKVFASCKNSPRNSSKAYINRTKVHIIRRNSGSCLRMIIKCIRVRNNRVRSTKRESQGRKLLISVGATLDICASGICESVGVWGTTGSQK